MLHLLPTSCSQCDACTCQIHQLMLLPAIQCSPGGVLRPVHAQQALHEQGHAVRLFAGDQVPARSRELTMQSAGVGSLLDSDCWSLSAFCCLQKGISMNIGPLCTYRRHGTTSNRTVPCSSCATPLQHHLAPLPELHVGASPCRTQLLHLAWQTHVVQCSVQLLCTTEQSGLLCSSPLPSARLSPCATHSVRCSTSAHQGYWHCSRTSFRPG